MVAEAASHGIKLLAYVYPCLAFAGAPPPPDSPYTTKAAHCSTENDRFAVPFSIHSIALRSAAAALPVQGNLLDAMHFHPQAATAGEGMLQMFGDVWEWTASPYVSYPGFRPLAGALGEYNGKFMCGQWVLRGGSCATPREHVRATYRNFFPPHARWQFMGIRLGQDR